MGLDRQCASWQDGHGSEPGRTVQRRRMEEMRLDGDGVESWVMESELEEEELDWKLLYHHLRRIHHSTDHRPEFEGYAGW